MSATPVNTPAQQGRTTIIILVVGLSLIAFGMTGFDPWFYKTVSLQINTNNPASGDFYQTYKLIFPSTADRAVCHLWADSVAGRGEQHRRWLARCGGGTFRCPGRQLGCKYFADGNRTHATQC
jgi:hypothetical protein